MRSGRVFTQLVEFSSGFPDGNLTWTVSTPGGTVLDTGSVTPTANSVSVVITVPAPLNTLSTGNLVEGRELSWSYLVGGISYGGDVRYLIEAPVPFPATPDGVRSKLGISSHELPDADIPLMDSYLEYRAAVDIDSLVSGTSRQLRLIANALEAMAGLAVLPTLQLRVAQSEESGTNIYARYSKADWAMLEASLRGYIAAANAELGEAAAAGTGLFLLAGPTTDPITGEAVA